MEAGVKLRDLTGKRFGRWTALDVAIAHDVRTYVRWRCVCDCGTTKYVAGVSLVNGDSRSCGCMRGEQIKARRTTHGLSRSVEYSVWRNMHARCHDPKNKAYANYGGRGIRVCDRWGSFEAFLSDMGERPDGMTLERSDNELNYSMENCRWASRAEQQRNTRRTVLVTSQGSTRTLTEWAAVSGIKFSTLAYRLKQGVAVDDALSIKPKPGRRLPRIIKITF